ncbi:MAG: C39 family peptidase [Thermoflexales bacterium]|nr:C39 family peptidase [Thermoflexales bacterium]
MRGYCGLPHGDVAGQWLDEDGEPVGAPFVIAAATEAVQFYRPYVSYNLYNQRFLVSMPSLSSAGSSRVAYALVGFGETTSTLRYVGAGEWTAGLERMVVSEANPADGTWLLFWDGGFYRYIPGSYPDHAWGLCGLAVVLDAGDNLVGDPFQVTEWGATAASQIVPAVAFDPGDQRWLLVWSTNPHGSPRRVLGRLVARSGSGGQITASSTISIAATYRDAFAPAVTYNPAAGEFLVALTINGRVGGTDHHWDLLYQRVLTDGTLPGGVEAPVPLPKHGTHNWTDANSLEVVTSDQQPATSEYLLSYASVRDGGGFFSGPYDVRQFKLSSQGSQLSNGLVSDYTPRATDGEYDVAVGDDDTVLAVWGDLRDSAPHVWGRRYGVGDELPTPRVTKYYYHGGQRVAMREGDVVYYLHGDHLGSTSLATYGSGPQAGQAVQDSRVWYYPYGEVRYGGEGSPTDFGFTGQKAVPGTGLMYYKARFYHPALGRFASADTIIQDPSYSVSLNRYAYAWNNPLRYTDSSGHCIDGISTWVCIGFVIAALALTTSGCAAQPVTYQPQEPQFKPQIQLPVIYNQLEDARPPDSTVERPYHPREIPAHLRACGPTCMAMILQYYIEERGIALDPQKVEPDDIVFDAQTKGYWDQLEGGVGPIAQMLQHEYGFRNVRTGDLTIEILQEAMQSGVPLIVGVDRAGEEGELQRGRGHAVVVVGFSGNQNQVILVDPYGGYTRAYDVELVKDWGYIWAEP